MWPAPRTSMTAASSMENHMIRELVDSLAAAAGEGEGACGLCEPKVGWR
jgi:hypothetical protein